VCVCARVQYWGAQCLSVKSDERVRRAEGKEWESGGIRGSVRGRAGRLSWGGV